jgi:hypothetical protein
MLLRLIALASLTLALGSTQATNASIAGMELQQLCSNFQGPGGLQCVSYMLGFTDGLSITNGLLDPAHKFCLPPNLTVGQAVLITNKFMREHPEDLHRSASEIIARALYIAYACTRNERAGAQTQ